MAKRPMPTGARLVAAVTVLFSCLAMVYVLFAFKPDLGLERREQGLLWLFGTVGLLQGWYGLGRLASEGKGLGIMIGMRATISVGLWLVVLIALEYVVRIILRGRLVGEEFTAFFFELFERIGVILQNIADPTLIAIFFGTGIFCGIVSRSAARIWD
ncbi:MAG: TrgA family protein [Pseudomonadota bacterium]